MEKKIIGLDSLRFFSFLAIFIYHTSSIVKFGYLGVDFFFVLSSFLLTFLALKEIRITQKFSRFNFFMRRALRIFPLYYLIVFFSLCILPILGSYAGYDVQLPNKQWMYWLLLANYEASDCIYALKFLWSIAVEEQFYLLFIAGSFLLKHKILRFIMLLWIAYFVFMYLATTYGWPIYTNTITHFPNFSLGILTGYLYFNGYRYNKLIGLLHILSLIGLMLYEQEVVFNFNISVFFACTILMVIKYAPSLKGCILFKITEKLGNYTYGLYVYSGFAITFVNKLLPMYNPIIRIALMLLLLIGVAICSYHIYEKPFLQFKKYFRS